jgi:hypothetical protein
MGTATADPAADEIRRAQEKGAKAKERAAAAAARDEAAGNGGAPNLPHAADDNGTEGAGVELVIDGSGQLSMAVGGKRVTTASLRLGGGKVDVEGQFEKGEILVLRVEAVVGEVAFVDQTDPKTRQVTGCDRRHKARIVALSVEDSHK